MLLQRNIPLVDIDAMVTLVTCKTCLNLIGWVSTALPKFVYGHILIPRNICNGTKYRTTVREESATEKIANLTEADEDVALSRNIFRRNKAFIESQETSGKKLI